jgi:signal transduction histidine kinase
LKAELRGIARRYAKALLAYLEHGEEEALLRAYQLGREALGRGLGVLEVSALHQEGMVRALLDLLGPRESIATARRASEFLAESLAPFEMKRRSAAETNASLRDLNRALEQQVRSALEDFQSAQSELDERRRIEQLKNDFISTVSHELRTPLTSIHGALGLIGARYAQALPPEAGQLLDVARRNSLRLVRLVNDILDLQKIESGLLSFALQPLELDAHIRHAVEATEPYAARYGATIAVSETPANAWLQADPDRLMQVMTNLLSNAAKFAPSGTSVTVSAARCQGMLRIEVNDRGPGIPEAFRTRVFERFAQADSSSTREREGSGLGLNISKAIVEKMGGRIGFDMELRAGTTFFVELPELVLPEASATEVRCRDEI